MVNLCKSHITALKKVRTNLDWPVTSMIGTPIRFVMTKDDHKKVKEARAHIDKAIKILEKCNQL